MSEIPHDEGSSPEIQFRALRDRPTPEVDGQRLWERIETRLTPHAVPYWRRLLGLGGASVAAGAAGAPRLAYGLATVALVVAVWLAWTLIAGGNGGQVVDVPTTVQEEAAVPADPQPVGSQLVLLTPGAAAAGQDAAPAPDSVGSLHIQLRLVRGYNGGIPDDVRAAKALGVGGADALGDVREQLDSLVAHDEVGIVGTWQGEVNGGDPLDAVLSDAYRVVAEAVEVTREPGIVLHLRDMAVEGVEEALLATDLNLIPGRPYILGVVAADGAIPSVLLIVEVDFGPAGVEVR